MKLWKDNHDSEEAHREATSSRWGDSSSPNQVMCGPRRAITEAQRNSADEIAKTSETRHDLCRSVEESRLDTDDGSVGIQDQDAISATPVPKPVIQDSGPMGKCWAFGTRVSEIEYNE